MLQQDLTNDLKTAMKAHDKIALDTIRMIKASLKNAEIAAGHELTADEELQVLATEMKQRKDSKAEFEKGGREDLIEKLDAEMAIVEKYLPAQLSRDEISAIVDETIAEVGASSKADFGKVMKTLMPKVKGRADGATINALVKEKLN